MKEQIKKVLKEEQKKMKESLNEEILAVKKKQWCVKCKKEANYYCCWLNSYCTIECQEGHWMEHRNFCRRKNAQED